MRRPDTVSRVPLSPGLIYSIAVGQFNVTGHCPYWISTILDTYHTYIKWTDT